MGGSPTMRKRLFHFSWPWAGVPNSSYYSHPQSKRKSVWAVCCLVSGLLGVTIAIHILLGPITSYRCHGDAEEFHTRQYTAPNQNQNQPRHRQRVLGFVGIQTGFGSSERRKALRDTWMPSHPDFLLKLQKETGLAFRFVIGRNSDRGKMAEIKKEMRTYKDFLFVDIEEEYKRLPYKTLAFFKAAFKLYDADFYVKVDDDIYLRPDRLATLLSKERSSPRTYIGCMKKGPVFTDPKLKWYESSGYMLGNEYFLHAYGPIYALSAEVVAGLSVLRNDSFRMFSNEDVTIGAWMLAMNVKHEDNRDICSPICTETSIAVWHIPKCFGLCNPVEQLQELHQQDSCYTSLTSQPINT